MTSLMELNWIEGELVKNIVMAPPKKALIKVKNNQQKVLKKILFYSINY